MGNWPELTEGIIRQRATPSSFDRGYDYYESGAVLRVVRSGNRILAEVRGSQPDPYRVTIQLGEHGIEFADCTCPYDWGGDCKHIVAVLLTCLYSPEEIEEMPPVEEMLSDLDRDQLERIIVNLIERRPELAEVVQSEIALLQMKPAKSSKPARPDIDTYQLRRQVRRALHSLDHMRRSEAYWHVGEVVDEIRRLLERAWDFIRAGEGRNALIVLEAITDEYIQGWTWLDDSDGEASSLFEDLDQAWTEAILSADLTQEERMSWAERLAEWGSEVEDYGVDYHFVMSHTAAVQGWDYPPLRRVLEGEITRLGAWEGEAPWYADDLAEARLNVLERQGRFQEYLYLAEAEGQYERYVTMLVRLGRYQEAVEYGLNYLSKTDEALALAKALAEKGEMELALKVAEHGLELEGYKDELARWIRDTASRIGRDDLALEAAMRAVREQPTLEDYIAVQKLAGERWSELREELLEHLRRTRSSFFFDERVDIFLHEGLVDDAIASLGKYAEYAEYHMLERVLDAAIPVRPDWVIRVCRQQAERIMDAGKSQYYHHAVNWLRKAKAAYLSSGRKGEWESYLEELLTKHFRKYKLVPMLKELR